MQSDAHSISDCPPFGYPSGDLYLAHKDWQSLIREGTGTLPESWLRIVPSVWTSPTLTPSIRLCNKCRQEPLVESTPMKLSNFKIRTETEGVHTSRELKTYADSS